MDTNNLDSKFLGSFDIEAYLCEFLQWVMRDEPDLAQMMAHDRCTLAKAARWMAFLSAIFNLFQFIFCLWAVDSISQPRGPTPERQDLSVRKKRDPFGRSTAIEQVPEVKRMVGKL